MSSPHTPAERAWWREPFRMFQTNLREIDAATLDVDATLAFIEDFGANAWLLSVGGIISNYPTRLDSQTANPALASRASGDLVGDVTAAAVRRGVHVVARMDFSKIDARRAERHPEWCFVAPDGAWQTYNSLTSVCPSADYYQHEIFSVISEVLDRYPIDGFFFNWWTFNEIDYSRRYRGVCRCAACQRRFGAFAPGIPLPHDTSSPAYDIWVAFSESVLDELGARMRAHIAARAPQAAFVQGDSADIVFHEANNAVGRTLWHHRTSDEVSSARTRRPSTPVLTNSVAFVDMPYRLAGEDPDHFAQHLVQAIARGANPSTYIMGSPADNPYDCLAVAREVTRFHRDQEHVYRDLRPSADAVLVRPDRATVSGARLEDALEEYRGIHEMLVQSHIPFDVVDARLLGTLTGQEGAAHLTDHRMIVLPDLGILPDTAVAVIDDFVSQGGIVVSTCSTGLSSTTPQFAGSPIAHVDASFDGVEELMAFHVRVSGSGWGDPVAVVGELHLVEPTAGARTAMPIVGRAPFGPPEKSHGNTDNGRWGMLVGDAQPGGQGRIAVLPWAIGRSYRATGASRLRRAFAAAIDTLAVEPLSLAGGVSEDAEIVLGESAAGPVAHVLNRSGDRHNRFAAPAKLPSADLVLPWPGVSSVRALVADVDLEVEPAGAGVRVRVPALGRYEVLVGARAGRNHT